MHLMVVADQVWQPAFEAEATVAQPCPYRLLTAGT